MSKGLSPVPLQPPPGIYSTETPLSAQRSTYRGIHSGIDYDTEKRGGKTRRCLITEKYWTKLRHVHILEHSAAIKKNGIDLYVLTQTFPRHIYNVEKRSHSTMSTVEAHICKKKKKKPYICVFVINVCECIERGQQGTRQTRNQGWQGSGAGMEIGASSGGHSGCFCIVWSFYSMNVFTHYLCHLKTCLVQEKRVLTQLCSRGIRMQSLKRAKSKAKWKEGSHKSREPPLPSPIPFPVFSPSAVTCGLKYVIPHFRSRAGRSSALFLFRLLPWGHSNLIF